MGIFGRGKLFGQFGSPRSVVGIGVLAIHILTAEMFATWGGLWWYAAAAVVCSAGMWITWLHAYKAGNTQDLKD